MIVLQDVERHTCIEISRSRGFVQYVPMVAGELTMERMREESFDETFKQIAGYPVKKGVEAFLNHGKVYGMTPSVRRYLTSIEEQQVNEETTAASETKAEKPTKTKATKKVAVKKTAAKKTEAKAGAGRPSTMEGKTFKVGNDDSVKRGFLREFVDFAVGLKKFGRDTLVKKFKTKVGEDRAIRYFAYCIQHEIFTEV